MRVMLLRAVCSLLLFVIGLPLFAQQVAIKHGQEFKWEKALGFNPKILGEHANEIYVLHEHNRKERFFIHVYSLDGKKRRSAEIELEKDERELLTYLHDGNIIFVYAHYHTKQDRYILGQRIVPGKTLKMASKPRILQAEPLPSKKEFYDRILDFSVRRDNDGQLEEFFFLWGKINDNKLDCTLTGYAPSGEQTWQMPLAPDLPAQNVVLTDLTTDYQGRIYLTFSQSEKDLRTSKGERTANTIASALFFPLTGGSIGSSKLKNMNQSELLSTTYQYSATGKLQWAAPIYFTKDLEKQFVADFAIVPSRIEDVLYIYGKLYEDQKGFLKGDQGKLFIKKIDANSGKELAAREVLTLEDDWSDHHIEYTVEMEGMGLILCLTNDYVIETTAIQPNGGQSVSRKLYSENIGLLSLDQSLNERWLKLIRRRYAGTVRAADVAMFNNVMFGESDLTTMFMWKGDRLFVMYNDHPKQATVLLGEGDKAKRVSGKDFNNKRNVLTLASVDWSGKIQLKTLTERGYNTMLGISDQHKLSDGRYFVILESKKRHYRTAVIRL